MQQSFLPTVILGLLWLLLCGYALHAQEVSISLVQQGEAQQVVMHPLLTQEPAYTIAQVQVQSDDGTTAEDISYWTGLDKGQRLSPQIIRRLQYYLHLLQRYKTVSLCIIPNGEGRQEVSLIFTLQAATTLQSVSVQGIWIGRQAMRSSYGIERGSMFRLSQHRCYIAQMQQNLRDQGYLHARVFDTLRFMPARHQVELVLSVDRGPRVLVRSVSVVLHGSSWQDTMTKGLTERLRTLLTMQLLLRPYSKTLIESIEQTLVTALTAQGLLRHKLWIDERLEHGHISLTIHVDIAENKQILITGNTHVSTASLIRHIMTTDEATWFLSEPFLQQVILRYYQEHGYTGTKVKAFEKASSWQITIQEGTIHRPSQPMLYGIDPLRETQAEKFFAPFVHSDIFQQQLLQQGITQLLSWYRSQGFWDATVVKIELQESQDSLAPLVIMEEGEQRLLAGIEGEGIEPAVLQQLCAEFLPQRRSVPFDSKLIQHIVERLRSITNGIVIAEPTLRKELAGLVLVLHATRQEATRFGNVVISGVPVQLARSLQREVLAQPYQPWTQEAITQTVDAISSIGVFKGVRARSAGMLDPDGQTPLVLHVVPDDPFEVRTRVGFAGVSKNLNSIWGGTYKVGGTMLAKSAIAYADQMRVDADFSRFYQHGEWSYRYPWLFGRPIRMFYKIFATKFEQPLSWGSDIRLYTCSRVAQSLGCSMQRETTSWGLTTWVEGLKIAGLARGAAPAIAFNPALVDAWVPYWSWEAMGRLNVLDDPTNPATGYAATLAAKIMAPLNSRGIFIGKLLAEQSVFVPISRSIVAAMRCRLGYIAINSFFNLLPSERFYLGGAATIRSYVPDFAPPLGMYIQDGKDIFIPMGGSRMVNANIELRMTPWQQVQVVIFQDLGFLSNSVARSGLLTATGLGVRYLTPLGPIRFDVGVRPHKLFPTDTRVGWFLTFGQAF